MRIILLEALVVSLMAGVAGYVVGIGATRLLLQFVTEHVPHFFLDPLVPLGAVFLAIIVGLAASLYPAMTAARMDPNEALRTL